MYISAFLMDIVVKKNGNSSVKMAAYVIRKHHVLQQTGKIMVGFEKVVG